MTRIGLAPRNGLPREELAAALTTRHLSLGTMSDPSQSRWSPVRGKHLIPSSRRGASAHGQDKLRIALYAEVGRTSEKIHAPGAVKDSNAGAACC